MSRHGKAADEEGDGRKGVAFGSKAEPGRVLQGLIDGAEEIREADDGHERPMRVRHISPVEKIIRGARKIRLTFSRVSEKKHV